MINDIALAGGIGVLMALVLSVPAIIHELRRRHHGHPLLIDIHSFGGKKLSDRETFALGILFQLMLGLVFGVLYTLNTEIWQFAGDPYALKSLSAYGLVLFLVAGMIVFPFMGLGLFGRREDKWIGIETFITVMLMVIGFFYVVQWFQPSWF